MIYAIWYPSGGGGSILGSILSLRGKNFARPKTQLKISNCGDAHSCVLAAPIYTKETTNYSFDFDPAKHYAVLVDHGIDNNSKDFIKQLNYPEVIKVYYDDISWPVVAQTCCEKAINTSLQNFTLSHSYQWPESSDWARREQYFLFLRDNKLRFMWPEDPSFHNINFLDLYSYTVLHSKLQDANIDIDTFDDILTPWASVNLKYTSHVKIAQEIVSLVQNNVSESLSHITNLWTQAVIYYFIWIVFGVEVPHNDFSNFFDNTKDIIELVS